MGTSTLINSIHFSVKQVILMSATLDSEMFSRYFSLPINGRLEGAPVVTVEGKSYPVKEYYLDDIIGAVRKVWDRLTVM